jgi:ribosomal 30S subunit maturation factor RimM
VERVPIRDRYEEVYALRTTTIWTYEKNLLSEPFDLTNFKVEATDGEIGKVDEATHDVGSSAVVVDTGPWILGRKVLLPAGVIEDIDLDRKRIRVRFTKDQIKNAPELDEMTDWRSDEYRQRVGDYYSNYS